MPIFERGDFDKYIPKTKEEYFNEEHSKTLSYELNNDSEYEKKFADIILYSLEGEILLLKRSPNSKIGPDKWCLPGGHVDEGETVSNAALRELLEETCICLKSSKFIGSIPNPNKTITSYFFALVEKSELNIVIDNNEHVNYAWLNYNQIVNKDLLFDLKVRLSLIFPSMLDDNLLENLYLRESNLLTYIKNNYFWLSNSYFWSQPILRSNNFNNLLNSLLDSDIVSLEDYFHLNKSENRYLLKAIANDPSHGGKLVKKQITDASGRKQTKWVSKNSDEGKSNTKANADSTNSSSTSSSSYKENVYNHASDASDEALKTAISSSTDKTVVDAAKHELIARDIPNQNTENVEEVSKKHPNKEIREEAKDELKSRNQDETNKILGKDYSKIKKLEDYAGDFDYTDAYSLELDQFANSFDEDVKDYFQRITGKDFDATTLAKMCGGIDSHDTKITSFSANVIDDEDNVKVLSVELKTDKYRTNSDFLANGVVKNTDIKVKKEFQKQGIGLALLTNQVNELSKQNCHSIELFAGREDDKNPDLAMNGYYTWSRVGYDFSNPSEFQSWAKDNKIKVDSFAQLMSIPQGREIWKDKGIGFDGKFDLSENSYSKLVLQNYLDAKNNEPKKTK